MIPRFDSNDSLQFDLASSVEDTTLSTLYIVVQYNTLRTVQYAGLSPYLLFTFICARDFNTRVKFQMHLNLSCLL